MFKQLIFASLFLLPSLTLHANQDNSYKMPRTEVIPIKDTQRNRQYELYIKLPESYASNTEQTYPVIYFTDAVWHIDILSASTAFLMEDVILVGISWQKDIEQALLKEHGEYVSRFRDYSMRGSNNPKVQEKYQLGQANNHMNFIQNNVFAFVEKHYRTQPTNRTYFGYSAGGAFGSYILLHQPETFKNYILGSPALQGDIPTLTELNSNSSYNQLTKTNIFVSYGKGEQEQSGDIDKFIKLLRKHKNINLTHSIIKGDHQTAFPRTGVESISWLASVQNTGNKS